MIKFNFNRECCGCFVCADACPQKCISLVKNEHGFLVPSVDESVCIDCHLCEKICPSLNPARKYHDERKVFSAYNTDVAVRAAGSSGSVFYTLAESIINTGGIVYGAYFDEHLQLKHTSAETINNLKPLLKSKYVQSNTNGVYKSVKSQLKKNRRVLFVGTPCQCNALYKFLGCRKPDNLLLVDFICHGVPSQDLFDKALASYEKKHNCRIEEFSFRYKQPDYIHGFSMKIKKINNEFSYHEGRFEDFPFYYGFKKYICLRESCYRCKFCVEDRVSDLTLADFWKLEKIDPSISEQEFNKGYSMVIVNSHCGKVMLDSVSHNLEIQERKVKNISSLNYAYTNPTKKGIYARRFWKDYDRMKYDDLEKKYFIHVPFHTLPLHKKIIRYFIWKFNL